MRKILLVDDDSAYTWCLQKYLQNRGYRVKTANTLEEARIAIKEEIPLLICCDLDLPDGSGLELLDMVRVAYGTFPFILASCYEKEDYEKEAMHRGATSCVDKLESSLLRAKLVEYAGLQLTERQHPSFL